MASLTARRSRLGALLGVMLGGLLSACVGGKGTVVAVGTPAPTANTLTLTVDGGPPGSTGAVNHPYVTVKVCTPGSTSKCASIDHVLLDTGSWGLRLVGSVLASHSVTLNAKTDAQGHAIEECVTFGGGQTWGPVALADVSLAGELAANLPVQIMDDAQTGAPAPTGCGANGTLINDVGGFSANGVLGVGVFAQDCGSACVNSATPLPVYFSCTSGATGVCTAVNVALTDQVTNPVSMFAADNNGVIVEFPNVQNANGDLSAQGKLTLGLGTQTDNALPLTGLTVLGADAGGDFSATYNGAATVLPALIDSGTSSYAFDDPTINVCSVGAYIGYYCPAIAPLGLSVVNTGRGTINGTGTLSFAISDPNTYLAGATAFSGLGGGAGSSRFTFGMSFFYGRKIYIGISQRVSGIYTGPFYAY
jgi:hypothetical protein